MGKESEEALKIIDELLDNYIDEAQVVDCPMPKERLLFLKQVLQELDKFKALLKKYEIKDIEALEELINDYDDMAKSLIQYALGIEVEVKS